MTTSANASVQDVEAALRAVPQRIVAAWAANDGDAFADVFAEDGRMILPNDVFLRGREEIRAFMRAAYAGPYRGSRVVGEPVDVRVLREDVAVVVTRGGVLMPGDGELKAERTIRATWLLVRGAGQDWEISSYQNTPVGA